MPAQPRPTDGDTITIDNLLIGMPYVEFTPTVNGVAQQPINLGVIDSAELAKELEELALESSQSGTRVTLRELITRIDPEFNIGTFNFAATVMQFSLGSGTLTPVVANAAAVVTDESITTTTDPLDYLALNQIDINVGSEVVTAAAVVDEQIGATDGSLGAASGDFTLDFKVFAVADVTRIDFVDSLGQITSFTPIAVAAAAAGNEVEVVVGTAGTSGDLQFFVGGVATDLAAGGRVEGDYEPTFTLTQGIADPDDYILDTKNGRLRVLTEATKATGTQVIIQGQAVFIDYTFSQKASTTLKPFTQTTFAGTARIRQLTGVGINFIWDIPKAQIQITDDALTFADDDFTVGNLTIKVLDAGGTDRFGTLQHFTETQANV